MTERHREPPPFVNVLCVFSYYARIPTGTKLYHDAVMIRVRRSRHIVAAFLEAMEALRAKWNPDDNVFPRPTSVTLESYLPQNGRRIFGRRPPRCRTKKRAPLFCLSAP
jgi:hypothetical protein